MKYLASILAHLFDVLKKSTTHKKYYTRMHNTFIRTYALSHIHSHSRTLSHTYRTITHTPFCAGRDGDDNEILSEHCYGGETKTPEPGTEHDVPSHGCDSDDGDPAFVAAPQDASPSGPKSHARKRIRKPRTEEDEERRQNEMNQLAELAEKIDKRVTTILVQSFGTDDIHWRGDSAGESEHEGGGGESKGPDEWRTEATCMIRIGGEDVVTEKQTHGLHGIVVVQVHPLSLEVRFEEDAAVQYKYFPTGTDATEQASNDLADFLEDEINDEFVVVLATCGDSCRYLNKDALTAIQGIGGNQAIGRTASEEDYVKYGAKKSTDPNFAHKYVLIGRVGSHHGFAADTLSLRDSGKGQAAIEASLDNKSGAWVQITSGGDDAGDMASIRIAVTKKQLLEDEEGSEICVKPSRGYNVAVIDPAKLGDGKDEALVIFKSFDVAKSQMKLASMKSEMRRLNMTYSEHIIAVAVKGDSSGRVTDPEKDLKCLLDAGGSTGGVPHNANEGEPSQHGSSYVLLGKFGSQMGSGLEVLKMPGDGPAVITQQLRVLNVTTMNPPKVVPGEDPDDETLTWIKTQFAGLVGLDSVKKEMIRVYTNTKKGTNKGTKPSYIFQGPPGVGKTHMARLLGEMLFKVGVLKKQTFSEIESGSDFRGTAMQNSSAEKTKALIAPSKGGVLFIDEAYNMFPPAGHGALNLAESNGQEIFREVMKMVNKEDRVVICAGYAQEMTSFVDGNKGFKSRIPKSGGSIITFDAYTVDELVEVFNRTLMKKGAIVDTDDVTPAWLKSQIEAVDETYRKESNARMIVTWIDRAIEDANEHDVVTCEETGDELRLLSLGLLKEALRDTIVE